MAEIFISCHTGYWSARITSCQYWLLRWNCFILILTSFALICSNIIIWHSRCRKDASSIVVISSELIETIRIVMGIRWLNTLFFRSSDCQLIPIVSHLLVQLKTLWLRKSASIKHLCTYLSINLSTRSSVENNGRRSINSPLFLTVSCGSCGRYKSVLLNSSMPYTSLICVTY